MDDEAMNPTVTLSANVDPYVQGMNQATEATKQSGAAISGLLDKMHQLNQSAAQKFQIVGAGSLASLTALALAADGANKQLNTLQASAAITGKNFGAFRESVASISSSMPRSRDEIAQLTTSISKLGITSQKQVDEFTRLFAKMGSATGGSPQVLADQMIKLSRTMGALDTQSVTKFSNSLTYVSAKLGTSAEGAAQFANSIAPFTRAAGIGEAATLGLGAAFSKSGSDGMVAANTFAKITSDITNSLASGSPEIKKYASALGMTVDQFSKMDSTERVVKLFEKITTSAKSAGVFLESIGIEGPRTARQIQQAVAEVGGIRRAVGLADSGGGNAIDVGSSAAEGNISDQFIKIKNASRATADALGEPLVGPLKAIARTMAAVTQAGTTMAQIFAPLLKLVVPLAAAFLALGTAMKIMGAMQTLGTAAGMTARGAMGGGLLSGMRSVTGAPQSAVGQMYADKMVPGYVPPAGGRQLTAYERGMYAAGRGVGNVRDMLSGGSASRGLFQTGAIGTLKGVQMWNNWSSSFAQQMGTPGPERTFTPAQSLINRYASNSRFATANLGPQPVPATAPGAATAPMASAPGFFGQARTWMNSTPEERAARKAGLKIGKEEFRGLQGINERYMAQAEQLKTDYTGKELKKKLKDLEKAAVKEVNALKDSASKQLATATKAMKEAGSVSAEAGKAVGTMGKNFGSWAAVAAKDLKGLTSMAGKVLAAPVKMFGGPMIAITAAMVAFQQFKKAKEDDKKNVEAYAGQSGLKDFYAAIGQSSPNQTSLQTVLKNQEKVVAKNTDFAEATDIIGPEYKQASTSGRKMTDSRFRKMSDQQILAYLRINNFDLKANPELLSQVANDIIQATGSGKRAQDILTAYSNGASTPGGAPQSPNAASGASPIQGAATETDYKARAQFYQKEAQGGWFTRNLGIGGTPEGLQAAISQDTTAAQNTAGALQNIYGSDTEQKTNIGAATAAMATNATISALPNMKDKFSRPWAIPSWASPTMNSGLLKTDAETQRIWTTQIRTLEKQFGIDPVGFSYSDFMSWSTKAGMDIRDPSQVNAALYQYLNTKGDRGKALATQMYGGEGQYAGKTAKQIQRELSKDISNFNPTQNSATKKKMDIVSAMTGNKSGGDIYASTLSPTAGGGMSAFAKSLSETGSEELKYAAGLEQATAAIKASNGDIQKAIATLGELAYNAGPGTQEAAIYRSAQTAAGFQGQMRTMEISPIENLRETASNARNTLNTSLDPAALTAAKDATVQVESTFRQILLSIINFNKSMARAEADYLKQRGYAIEDFKKQKQYQIEDAAKSMSNPYQPLQAQSTVGGAALLQNYTRGTSRIAEHLENLKKLEKLGLSRSTIQQLDLINPANFQETVVLIDYLKSNPSKVDQFNKQTENRIKNTSALMNSGFVEAFRRGDEAFKTGMTRMEESYNTTMSRAKTDFNDTMNGMTGNLETLFNRATSKASTGIKALGRTAKKNLQETFDAIYSVKVTVSDGDTTPAASTGGGKLSYDANGNLVSPAPASASWPSNTPRIAKPEDFGNPGFVPKGYEGAKYKNYVWKKDGDPISGYQNWGYVPRAYGGQVDAGKSYVVGEKGPELLQGVSGHIMPSSSFQTSVARETVQMMRVAGFANQTTYKGAGVTNVDNSTKIMGGQFTVVTNDPDAMGRQLKGKERLDRLRTGKRTP